MEILRRIANGVLIAAGSTLVAGVAWLILVVDVGLARILLEKRLISPGARVLTALFLILGIGLLALYFWLLGGLHIGLR